VVVNAHPPKVVAFETGRDDTALGFIEDARANEVGDGVECVA